MWGKVQPATHKLTALARDKHLLSSSQWEGSGRRCSVLSFKCKKKSLMGFDQVLTLKKHIVSRANVSDLVRVPKNKLHGENQETMTSCNICD